MDNQKSIIKILLGLVKLRAIGPVNDYDTEKSLAKRVIDCKPNYEDIKKAIKKLYSKEFKNLLKYVKNPYEKEGTTDNIVKIIKKMQIKNLYKEFFDINFEVLNEKGYKQAYHF